MLTLFVSTSSLFVIAYRLLITFKYLFFHKVWKFYFVMWFTFHFIFSQREMRLLLFHFFYYLLFLFFIQRHSVKVFMDCNLSLVTRICSFSLIKLIGDVKAARPPALVKKITLSRFFYLQVFFTSLDNYVCCTCLCLLLLKVITGTYSILNQQPKTWPWFDSTLSFSYFIFTFPIYLTL